MSPDNRSIHQNIILFLCFMAPALVMLVIYAGFGMEPFGDKSILIMDLSNQYVEFFSGLRQIVSGDSSIFFSWSNGLGGSNIGLFAYYLSSPLSFLTLLFPADQLPQALMLLIILKIGLSGLTFGIFLKSRFRRSDLSIVWFSLLYGLMSYSIVYSMCVMWLDGVVWLPIVILGIDKLLEEDNPLLLTTSLTAVFISTYYLSYMIGIFSAIYFLYRYASDFYKFDYRFFYRKFIAFSGSAIAAVCLNAWFLLPTIFSMMQGKIGGANFTPQNPVNFDFFNLFYKMYLGSADSIKYDGLPSIFCGTAVLMLVTSFFFSKSIRFRNKVLTGTVFAFLILSFYSQKIDIAWHLFQHPNWFPFRYAFVFSFFCLYVAYQAYLNIRDISIWFSFIFILCTSSLAMMTLNTEHYYLSSGSIVISFFFTAVYSIFLLILKFEAGYSKALLTSLIILSAFEIYLNGQSLLKGLDRDHKYLLMEEYRSFKESVEPLVRSIQFRDTSYYRMESLDPRTKNDSIGFGYRGVAHFSSTYNRDINRLLKDFGFLQTFINTTYEGETLITESLLGVKYLISKSAHVPDHNWDSSQGIYNLHENPYALGIGFAAEDASKAIPQDKVNALTYQASLLESMAGSHQQLLDPINDFTLSVKNISIDKRSNYTRYKQQDPSKDATMTYQLTAPDKGPIYAVFPTKSNDGVAMYLNGAYKGPAIYSGTPRIISLGSYEKGDSIQLKFRLKQRLQDIEYPYFARLDLTELQNTISSLKHQELKLSEFSCGKIKGEITANSHQFLFTSIPFDDSWVISVDGTRVTPFRYLNALLAIPLDAGTHHIEMSYVPKGLHVGTIISVGSFFLLILYWIHHSYRTRVLPLLTFRPVEET